MIYHSKQCCCRKMEFSIESAVKAWFICVQKLIMHVVHFMIVYVEAQVSALWLLAGGRLFSC